MKKILLTVLVTLSSLIASAQIQEPGQLSLTAHAGSGLSIFHDMPDKAGSLLCSTIGVDAKYQLAWNFGVSAGLAYDYYISGKINKDELGLYTKFGRYEFAYVNMPILAHLDIYHFGLQAGIQPGVRVFDKRCDLNIDDAAPFTASVPIGISWTFDIPLIVGLRYTYPLTKAIKGADHKSHVSGIMLTLGYRFDL